MSAAIFGLIGVLLGGIITVLESRRKDSRRDKREREADAQRAKVARRLVADDLRSSAAYLKQQPTRGWVKMGSRALALSSWPDARATLAGTLSAGDWDTVSRACVAVGNIRIVVERFAGFGVPPKANAAMMTEFALETRDIALEAHAVLDQEP